MLASYWACAAGLLVGGVGVAAFHPEGARFASYVSGSRPATGMSFFSVGGNAGFALGPIAVSLCVGIGGLQMTPLLFASFRPAGVHPVVLPHRALIERRDR